MAVLVQQRKSLVLILVKQRQNFATIYITIMIIVICLIAEKKSISLKQIIKMSTFQVNFVYEASLINLTSQNKLEKVDVESEEASLTGNLYDFFSQL